MGPCKGSCRKRIRAKVQAEHHLTPPTPSIPHKGAVGGGITSGQSWRLGNKDQDQDAWIEDRIHHGCSCR